MCSIGYDRPDLYESKIVKARKEHQCTECHRLIAKGENYRWANSLYEGMFDTYKTCRHCLVLQDWLIEKCGGFLHEGLHEEIQEHAEEYHQPFLYRGLAGIRRGWKKLYSNELMPVMKQPAQQIGEV